MRVFVISTLTATAVTGAITEGSVLSDSGSIAFADLDLTDTPTATEATSSVSAVLADGTTALTLTSAQQTAIEDAFSISAADGNSNDGTINWDYTVSESDLNFLAADEVVTAVFTYPKRVVKGKSEEQGGPRNIKKNMGQLKDKTGKNVLGMKVVLPNGDIYNDTQGFYKNNTGYHIKNLMIGAEGTLGVVTECQLKLQKSKPSVKGMLFSLNNLEQLSKLIELSTNTLQDFISAFELMDKKSLILHQKHFSNLPISIGNFNVLIETQFTDDDYHQSVLDKFFENCMENELIEDGTVTNNETQLNQLWSIREGITENLSKEPKSLYKFDISIKLNDIHTLQQKLKDYDTYFFGHVLDENIHLNILNDGSNNQIENIVYNLVNELNGSISAEHGIGIMKKKYLHQYDTKNQIQLLKDIKKTFDPNNILNPGLITN